MSKVLAASCVNGKVTVEGFELSNVEILSEGDGASTGVVIIDTDRAYYLAKTSPDLDTTLAKVMEALEGIKVAVGPDLQFALTLIGSSVGPSEGAAAASASAQITAGMASVTAAINALTTLKGALK